MKKRIVALLTVAAMTVALTACGGSKQAAPAAPAAPAPEASADADAAAPEAPAAPVADGKVYNLTVTNHDSSNSVGEQWVETFCNQISEASGGRLQFTYNAGGSLFNGGEAVAAVRDGAADVCWNATSITVGVFPVSEFVNVPLNGINCARFGSQVINDMFHEIPECAAEYDDFFVMEVQACSAAPFSTKFKINSPADFKGKAIRAAGTVQSNYVNMIGAAASSMGTSEVYEAMEKGVVAGMTNDWHNIDCFNLYEVTDYVLDYTINTTSCFLLMNKDTYNDLPADLQQLLVDFQSYGSAMAGYYWDCMRFITGDKMEERGVEIYEPTDELRAFLESDANAAAMKEWYIGYLTEKGYSNAAEIWDKCMAIVDRYAADYTAPFAERIELSGWDASKAPTL